MSFLAGLFGAVSSVFGGVGQSQANASARRDARRLRDYENATDRQNYEFALRNRNYEFNQLNRIYDRSLDVYRRNLNFNNQAAQRSYLAEQRVIDEQVQRLAFDRQDLFVQMLRDRGSAEARGVVGNTAGRMSNSVLAEFGRNNATLSENLVSAYRQHSSNMEDITLQRRQADLEAFSRLGLRPRRPPRPPRPISRPVASGGASPLLSIASGVASSIASAIPRSS